MCICVLKVVLGVINFVFLIIGLAIAAVGGILIWGAPIAQSLLSQLFSTLQSTTTITVSLNDIVTYILSYAATIGTPLIIIGLIIAAIGFCGLGGSCCCCLCCCNRIFLIIYIIATGIIFLAIIVLIIVIFAANTQIDQAAKSLLAGTMTGYSGVNSTNAQSLIWNILMVQMSCCGISNGSDFDAITTWQRKVSYNGYSVNSSYPATCCMMDTSTYKPKYTSCPYNFTSINSNVGAGCYSSLRNLITSYGVYGIIGVGVAAGFMLLMIVFSVIILQDLGKVSPV
jgi:hypothetical protein